LSNRVYQYLSAAIYQDNVFIFRDPNVNFALYSIQGVHDGVPPWKVNIPALGNTYNVYQILPDGGLVLINGTPALWNTSQSGVGYSLLDASLALVHSSGSGVLNVVPRGRVDLTGSSIIDIRDLVEINNNYYVYNMAAIGTQYLISGFIEGSTTEFYIDGYSGGDLVGTTVTILRRNVDAATGSFAYQGLKLTTPVNYEVNLNIQNGTNNLYPPGGAPTIGNLKENYLFKIGSDYYAIEQIDGTNVVLQGPTQTWYLFGLNVPYEVYRYTLTGPFTFPNTAYPTIPEHTLDYINRSKGEIIDHFRQDTAGNYFMISPLLVASAMSGKTQMEDMVNQQESITYSIEFREGDQ
jgi:hypothetical protein